MTATSIFEEVWEEVKVCVQGFRNERIIMLSDVNDKISNVAQSGVIV